MTSLSTAGQVQPSFMVPSFQAHRTRLTRQIRTTTQKLSNHIFAPEPYYARWHAWPPGSPDSSWSAAGSLPPIRENLISPQYVALSSWHRLKSCTRVGLILDRIGDVVFAVRGLWKLLRQHDRQNGCWKHFACCAERTGCRQ